MSVMSVNKESLLAEAIALLMERLDETRSMAKKVAIENRFLALNILKKMKKDMKRNRGFISSLKRGEIRREIVDYFEEKSEIYVTATFGLTKDGYTSESAEMQSFSVRWIETTLRLKRLL